jgi:ATP-dependent helicase/nuclease subunit A
MNHKEAAAAQPEPLPMHEMAAFEHNGATVARARFYAIACDPRRSVAVEACAGAGKTWMLVSRMVRALLQGCEPHEILAITFTKKAAGEMRQRLQQWLLQFAGQDDDELRQELRIRGITQEVTAEQLRNMRQLHQTLLHKGRSVQIRTFHSWFAALLRSAPLQALVDLGLPTHYELLENDAQAVARVWPRFQTHVASNPTARKDYGDAVATFGRFQTQKALESALSKRVEFALADAQGVVDASVRTFALQYPQFAGLETLEAWLQTASARGLLMDAARLLGASTLAACKTAATDLEQALSLNEPDAVILALFTKAGTARKFSDKVVGISTVRQAQDQVLQWMAAQTQHQAWLHQQRMARLTRILVAQYTDLKQRQGWVDMGDLERAALALMSDPVLSGWVQEKLDARVRHLMIDEFQDTNPLQWQALSAWLSSYGGAGSSPSVFLVGDPKQSIYRFRRAEPQVFKAAQRFVQQTLGGDLLSCDHTRRNAPAIIGLVNQVMTHAQAAGQFDGYRLHSTESQEEGWVYQLPRIGRDAKEGAQENPQEDSQGDDSGIGIWRDSLTTPRRVAEETRKTLECRQAARWLAQQIQSGALRPHQIMVLARKRERLGLMQAELTAMGIAAQQPEKRDLSEMPEVQDLIGLLDVLVSPAHNLSLARVLKSPVFGVDDADLVQLVLHQRALQAALSAKSDANAPEAASVPWLHVLQQASDLPPALATLGATLTLWQTWVNTLPPHDALSAIYHHGDVLARYAAATPPTQIEGVLANLRALLSASLQVDGGRYASAYAFVRALRAGGIAAPVRADTNAVRLLTIHGAKGLEAPCVLILDTDGESIRAQTMAVLVDWPGEAACPERFVFLASESKPSACVADALAHEQAARNREEINALYVALTRTQHTLVLSSMQPHIANPQSWWQRLQAHALDAPWQPEAGGDAPELDPEPAHCAGGALAPGYTLLSMPNMPLAQAEQARAAIKTIADDSLDSRIGQAMHRLLEWYVPCPNPTSAPPWTPAARDRVAQEFALELGQLEQALAMAQAILQGEGAWAWDAGQLNWQGNEVALVHRGRMLRIDRLVQRLGCDNALGAWWVLDYKSTAQPEQQPALCEQLLGYRAAVARAQPGQIVRAAFLTAQGYFIEIA